ncbi:MAG: GtrA family protein [Pikeienuella sp.]
MSGLGGRLRGLFEHRFLRFLFFGGVSALANILARVAFSRVMPFEAAVAAAHLVGMAVAYTSFRLFVFAPTGRSMRAEVTGFVLVNLWSLAQIWVVSVGLYRLAFPAFGWTWQAALIAHSIGVGTTAVTSFLGHKYLTFRPAQSPSENRR